MTAITERVPVAEIGKRAHKVRFGATLLAAVTGALFGLGWLVAKLFAVCWLTLAWAFTAVRVGWEHAHLQAAVPKISVHERAELLSENESLRAEVARLSGG
jgi:hypothetical protein